MDDALVVAVPLTVLAVLFWLFYALRHAWHAFRQRVEQRQAHVDASPGEQKPATFPPGYDVCEQADRVLWTCQKAKKMRSEDRGV